MKLVKLALTLVLTIFTSELQATNQYICNYFFTYIDNNKEIAIRYLLSNANVIPDASYILGIVYLENKQYNFAEEFLLKAAFKNHKPAINALGDFYYSDKKNIKKAVEYYEKGAKMEYGPSQFNLGIIYSKHYGQRGKARYLLTKASQNSSDLCEKMRAAALKYRDSIK